MTIKELDNTFGKTYNIKLGIGHDHIEEGLEFTYRLIDKSNPEDIKVLYERKFINSPEDFIVDWVLSDFITEGVANLLQDNTELYK